MKKSIAVLVSITAAGTFLMTAPVVSHASKAIPVGVAKKARANFKSSPKAKRAIHLSKNYRKTMMWATKAKTYRGQYYRLVRTKKKTLGYIRSSSLVLISKPTVKFAKATVNQNDAFDANKGVTWKYMAPDKVHYTYTSHVDTSKTGNYTVVYHFKDSAGYKFSLNRKVVVRGVSLVSIYNPNEVSYNHTLDVPLYNTSATNTTYKLTPRLNVASARNQLNRVKWSSDNPNVASVNNDGQVITNNPGMAQISATFNGKTIKEPVLVTNSSHTGFKSSDNLVNMSFDGAFYFSTKSTLRQKVIDYWITNGTSFIHSKPFSDERVMELTNMNTHTTVNVDGTYYDDLVNGKSTGIINTQDELGNTHTYVANYNSRANGF